MKIKNVTFDTKTTPKVCVAIVATTEAMFNQRWQETNREDIDVIEWRADYYIGDDTILLELLKAESRPVIYTIRTKEEGGEWPYQKGSISPVINKLLIQGLLMSSISNGPEMVKLKTY